MKTSLDCSNQQPRPRPPPSRAKISHYIPYVTASHPGLSAATAAPSTDPCHQAARRQLEARTLLTQARRWDLPGKQEARRRSLAVISLHHGVSCPLQQPVKHQTMALFCSALTAAIQWHTALIHPVPTPRLPWDGVACLDRQRYRLGFVWFVVLAQDERVRRPPWA